MKRLLVTLVPAVALLIFAIVLALTGNGNDPRGDDFWSKALPSAAPTEQLPSEEPTPDQTTTASPTPAPSDTLPSPAPSDATPPVNPATDQACAAPAPVDTVAMRDEKDGLCVAVYTVKEWDYLSGIAERYGSQLSDVYQWSLGSLGPNADPNLIYPGQQIVVKVLAKL